MAQALSKFVTRAPRYKLRPFDNKYLRFAHNDDKGKSFTTQFRDISVSGVSFVTEMNHAPGIGETIKVEIPLDGDDRFAWFGVVVRIESYSPTKWWLQDGLFKDENIVLVAISFSELPAAHRSKIRASLRKKFQEIQKEKRVRTLINFGKYASENTLKMIMYGLMFTATIWLLWTLSQPSPNYDPKKGSPWGERFPGLNFFDQ